MILYSVHNCIFLFPYSGNEQNGDVFRENGGTKCALTLVNYNKPRRLALRLLTQLILLKGKACHIGSIEGHLHVGEGFLLIFFHAYN